MEVYVNGKRRLNLPSALVFNRLTGWLLGRWGLKLTWRQWRTLARAVRTCRRTHPDWVLVEVEEADGDHITIRL